jgi:hypothetical protein
VLCGAIEWRRGAWGKSKESVSHRVLSARMLLVVSGFLVSAEQALDATQSREAGVTAASQRAVSPIVAAKMMPAKTSRFFVHY